MRENRKIAREKNRATHGRIVPNDSHVSQHVGKRRAYAQRSRNVIISSRFSGKSGVILLEKSLVRDQNFQANYG